jgi:DNA-binding CsgD family transcriptional regulator
VRNATGRTRAAHFSPHRGELLGIRLLAGALESERNDLDVADSSLSGVVVAAAADHPPGNRYHVRGVVELAKVRVAQGRADEALALVADLAGDTSVSLSPLARAWVDGFRAVVLAATGRTDAASELAETLPDLPSCVVVSGRVALAAGHLDRAAACASAIPLDTPRREIEARLLRASVLGTSGDDHLAADELQRAVAIASTEGFVRTLLDFSPMVDALLARLPVGPVEYVESLRQAVEARSTVIDLRSPAELVDPLSARELEVLAYLPTRLSTRQIAAELYISLNTLKTHVSAIYRKLDASSRSEAVLKARGVGLLR